MKAKTWSPVDDAALKTLWKEGKTDARIGRLLNRTENAVRERRSQIGAVKYTNAPYTPKNPSKASNRATRSLAPGAQVPLFDLGKTLHQPEQKRGPVMTQEQIREHAATNDMPQTFREDFPTTETGTGSIVVFVNFKGCGVSVQGRGLAPRQAARILLAAISKIV